jgi:hypothetical protein
VGQVGHDVSGRWEPLWPSGRKVSNIAEQGPIYESDYRLTAVMAIKTARNRRDNSQRRGMRLGEQRWSRTAPCGTPGELPGRNARKSDIFDNSPVIMKQFVK